MNPVGATVLAAAERSWFNSARHANALSMMFDRLEEVPTVTFVYIVLAVASTFVIAAVVVGREAHRLDAVAPRTVYILQEALEFVAEYLRITA